MAKTKVLITIDNNLLAAVDKLSEELGMSRSKVMEACIESGFDDWKLLGFVGMTPRRMRALCDALRKVKQWRFGDITLDAERGRAKAERLIGEVSDEQS